MSIATIVDLAFVACSSFVLGAGFDLIADGYTVDAIVCFTAVAVNAMFVLMMDGRRSMEAR